jgi:hypothetical protein
MHADSSAEHMQQRSQQQKPRPSTSLKGHKLKMKQATMQNKVLLPASRSVALMVALVTTAATSGIVSFARPNVMSRSVKTTTILNISSILVAAVMRKKKMMSSAHLEAGTQTQHLTLAAMTVMMTRRKKRRTELEISSSSIHNNFTSKQLLC